MFLKDFEIRWNDLDANRHLANTSFSAFASNTRMAFLSSIGFGHAYLEAQQLGPVLFHEKMYYFREFHPDELVRVSLELAGLSEDGRFFEFNHNYYNTEGINKARSNVMGAWMDLNTRKLTGLSEEAMAFYETVPRAAGFRFLTSEDTRKEMQIPKDISF